MILVAFNSNLSKNCIVLHLLQTSGYLNLLANCIDNFTHGLAVAGSFLVSKKVRFCDINLIDQAKNVFLILITPSGSQ